MKEKAGLIQKHGGYRKLKSYQIAQLIYDFTVRFCQRYIDRRSRVMAKWMRDVCGMKEYEKLWRIGRGLMVEQYGRTMFE